MTNWLYIIHYSTLKINHTVKLVKLFEKMFIWAPLFLITASRRCFHWSMLLLMKVYLRRQFETVDQLNAFLLIECKLQTLRLSSTTALMNGNNILRLLLRTTELTMTGPASQVEWTLHAVMQDIIQISLNLEWTLKTKIRTHSSSSFQTVGLLIYRWSISSHNTVFSYEARWMTCGSKCHLRLSVKTALVKLV